MNNDKYRAVFKRLETDREYRERLAKSNRLTSLQYAQIYACGVGLDELGDSLQPPVQRRIVEDVT